MTTSSHDEECESEFVDGPMLMGPCGCAERRAFREQGQPVPAAELARAQTDEDLIAGLTAEVNRLASAAHAREMEYHLACELASMMADHLDGIPIDPSKLHRMSRRRITAYRHWRGIGALGIPGTDEFGTLPAVPVILHDGGDLARREIIDVDPI